MTVVYYFIISMTPCIYYYVYRFNYGIFTHHSLLPFTRPVTDKIVLKLWIHQSYNNGEHLILHNILILWNYTLISINYYCRVKPWWHHTIWQAIFKLENLVQPLINWISKFIFVPLKSQLITYLSSTSFILVEVMFSKYQKAKKPLKITLFTVPWFQQQ